MGKMEKVLSCLVIGMLLISVVPGSAVAQSTSESGEQTIPEAEQEENTWIKIAEAPCDIGGGGGVVFYGNALYVMCGGGSKDFWKLDLNSNSWTKLASLPEGVGYGAGMAFDGARYIYVTKGTTWLGLKPSNKFWRYDINQNIWETLPDTPEGVGAVGSICYANGLIYLRPGNHFSRGFYAYSPDSQSWEKKASGPRCALAAGPRCAMAYDGK